MGLQIGQSVSWTQPPCTLQGIVSTGGAEDQELARSPRRSSQDHASFLQIRAPGDRVEPIRSALAKQFPGVDVRTVRAIAETESNVVLKMRGALLLLTLLILVITTLCVTSNFSEMVIERSKEIGIMKALGAAERKIAALFVSESAALALAATVAGYIAGVFAAAAIGREIFGGAFHPQPDWLVFLGVGGGYAGSGGSGDGDRHVADLEHPARDHSEGRVNNRVSSFIELVDVSKTYGSGEPLSTLSTASASKPNAANGSPSWDLPAPAKPRC